MVTAPAASATGPPGPSRARRTVRRRRRTGRGRGRARRRRRLTEDEKRAAEEQRAYLEENRITGDYTRELQNKVMDVVQHLQNNGGERFLRDVDPAEVETGWDLAQELNLDAIEVSKIAQTEFYELVGNYLGSLKHAKLKFPDGTPLNARHNTLKKYNTALNNVWRKANRPIPTVYALCMSKLLESSKKFETKMKAAGLIPDTCGRDEMSFRLYRELAWYFLSHGNMFAHLFLILCWNTMVRNCNCDDLIFEHCAWVGDCFGISVKKTKTNQDGTKTVQSDIKHIYANPVMPEICPILALALYFLHNPFIGHESRKLFPGKNTQKTFNEAVTKALADPEFTAHLDTLGITHRNIGAYSTRKGSATYCTSGTTCGPSIIAVCLRAGWAIGKTLESYLRSAQAGDQFCGRVVCGLPVLSHLFAALPPHFKVLEQDDRNMMMAALKSAYPFHGVWGSSFQPVATFMLASLVKHQSWIKRKLPAQHALMSKTLFTSSELVDLEEFLATGEESGLKPTGVPPHTMLFGQVHKLIELVQEMQRQMLELPGQIKAMIQSCFLQRDTENGTASVGVMQIMFDKFQKHMQDQWTRMFERVALQQRRPIDPVHAVDAAAPEAAALHQRGGGIWMWSHPANRKLKKYTELRGRWLPKEFRLSFDLKSKKRLEPVDCADLPITRKRITTFDAWTYWWEGVQWGDSRIRPLFKLQKHLSGQLPRFHFMHDNARKRYDDMKCLMNAMVTMIEDSHTVESVANADRATKRLLFRQGWNLITNYIQQHHPLQSKKEKKPKEIVCFTTLKKDYYDACRNAALLADIRNA